MEQTRTTYYCDRCNKDCAWHSNSEVVISQREGPGQFWSRFHVRIIRKHGMYNEAKEDIADLCQDCAADLFTKAVVGIKVGLDENKQQRESK